MADGAGRELKRLADQEAALRRVATLVARGVPPREVFAAVAREVGLLLGVGSAYLAHYDADGTATGVATWSPDDNDIPVGRRVTLEGDSVVGTVSRTGRPARVDDYAHAAGSGAALVRELGLGSSVGAPIVVDVPAERLPPEIETNAYFIVAEALTNVVKHAGAEHAAVTAAVEGGVFRVEVRDDGIGGVDPDGHGLTGLRDRATALGGRLVVESPPSGGTIVAATLPLPEA